MMEISKLKCNNHEMRKKKGKEYSKQTKIVNERMLMTFDGGYYLEFVFCFCFVRSMFQLSESPLKIVSSQ